LERDIGTVFDLYYFTLTLSLFIIAVITIFITILVIPPVILFCIMFVLVISGGLFSVLSDKSIIQKKE